MYRHATLTNAYFWNLPLDSSSLAPSNNTGPPVRMTLFVLSSCSVPSRTTSLLFLLFFIQPLLHLQKVSWVLSYKGLWHGREIQANDREYIPFLTVADHDTISQNAKKRDPFFHFFISLWKSWKPSMSNIIVKMNLAMPLLTWGL